MQLNWEEKATWQPPRDRYPRCSIVIGFVVRWSSWISCAN